MKLSDFSYELPEELIAQHPLENRDESRMILVERWGGGIRETHFSNFARYLKQGNIVVINETKVIPARFFGEKKTGAGIEIFLSKRLAEGRWEALCRPSKRLSPGDSVFVGESAREIRIVRELGNGEWIVSLPEEIPEKQFIRAYGHVPLPPYIKREDTAQDAERYQTIFAHREGSVAAPTAGLHFTDKVLRDIERKGCSVLPLTLHVGPGTFRPLEDETVENNVLSPEFFMIREDYWQEIREARGSGREIIAVGTTVTRTLEALAAGRVTGLQKKEMDGVDYITGWTDLFLYPGCRFAVVDAIVTNLHLPMSSLFVLVCAFAGRDEMMRIYKWAVQRKFRFYSYGDAMFIR